MRVGYLPRVFTEHGALMAATILSSPRAVEVSIYVVRAFVQLRDMANTHQGLAKRLDALGAWSQRVVTLFCLLRSKKRYGKHASWQRPHDAENSSRAS